MHFYVPAVCTMQSVIESFGIPYNSLSGLLSTFDGCIAGSSALYGYLYETENPSWKPNDMDIWIKVPGLTKEQCRDGARDVRGVIPEEVLEAMSIKRVVKSFMARNGYKKEELCLGCDEMDELKKKGLTITDIRAMRQKRIDDYIEKKNEDDQLIFNIMFFVKDNKKIQIILTSDVPRTELLDRFDMSVCAIAWDPITEFSTSLPQALYDAKHKRTDYKRSTQPLSLRGEKRVQKYKERGFKIYVPLE